MTTRRREVGIGYGWTVRITYLVMALGAAGLGRWLETDGTAAPLRDLGPDYVMWGTDSILWGNPQWQIEAFRKFQIPDQLVEGHGYPKLTPEVKAKVFGLNAARIWNLPVPRT